MGFEEEREQDPWSGGPHFSKWDLLRTAVKCGAVLGAENCPYEGAHWHAQELIAEGLLVALPPPPGGEGVRWLPTLAGGIIGTP